MVCLPLDWWIGFYWIITPTPVWSQQILTHLNIDWILFLLSSIKRLVTKSCTNKDETARFLAAAVVRNGAPAEIKSKQRLFRFNLLLDLEPLWSISFRPKQRLWSLRVHRINNVPVFQLNENKTKVEQNRQHPAIFFVFAAAGPTITPSMQETFFSCGTAEWRVHYPVICCYQQFVSELSCADGSAF